RFPNSRRAARGGGAKTRARSKGGRPSRSSPAQEGPSSPRDTSRVAAPAELSPRAPVPADPSGARADGASVGSRDRILPAAGPPALARGGPRQESALAWPHGIGDSPRARRESGAPPNRDRLGGSVPCKSARITP